MLKLVGEGIIIPDEVLFFAESTWGLSPEEIETALQDPRFEVRDELLALILSPDKEKRAALEALLRAEPACTEVESDTLVGSLWKNNRVLHIIIPEVTRFDLPVELEDFHYLISKCYLDRPLDSTLVAALGKTFSPKTVISCRLALRCRSTAPAPEKVEFLCRFTEKSGTYEDIFVELFTLAVRLLAEINDDTSIEQYFLDRRRQLIKTLRDIKSFAEKRERYSMEYLMMQRYPVPHESEEQVRHQLRLVTTITDAILGFPPDPYFQTELRNLGTYGRRKDISRVIRVLS